MALSLESWSCILVWCRIEITPPHRNGGEEEDNFFRSPLIQWLCRSKGVCHAWFGLLSRHDQFWREMLNQPGWCASHFTHWQGPLAWQLDNVSESLSLHYTRGFWYHPGMKTRVITLTAQFLVLHHYGSSNNNSAGHLEVKFHLPISRRFTFCLRHLWSLHHSIGSADMIFPSPDTWASQLICLKATSKSVTVGLMDRRLVFKLKCDGKICVSSHHDRQRRWVDRSFLDRELLIPSPFPNSTPLRLERRRSNDDGFFVVDLCHSARPSPERSPSPVQWFNLSTLISSWNCDGLLGANLFTTTPLEKEFKLRGVFVLSVAPAGSPPLELRIYQNLSTTLKLVTHHYHHGHQLSHPRPLLFQFVRGTWEDQIFFETETVVHDPIFNVIPFWTSLDELIILIHESSSLSLTHWLSVKLGRNPFSVQEIADLSDRRLLL